MRRIAIVLLIASCACQREARQFQQPPSRSQSVAVSDLYPGGGEPPQPSGNPAERNAYAVSEGKTLYVTYNCAGCHANGGGGMGPALMDDRWIYGYHPEQIFRTILEGRPNGMPAFRSKIPDYQIWELAAYVRSMSGLVPKDVAPGRDDHLSGKPPESSTERMTPTVSTDPAVP